MVDSESPSRAHRQTAQKVAIRAALARSDAFVSAQDLHTTLRAEGIALGLATVYRNLNEMVRTGEADVLQAEPNVQLYRSCGGEHHHHLYCVDCGRTVEVDPPIEEWVDAVTAAHGFTRVRHVIDIFGVCADCRGDGQTRPAR